MGLLVAYDPAADRLEAFLEGAEPRESRVEAEGVTAYYDGVGRLVGVVVEGFVGRGLDLGVLAREGLEGLLRRALGGGGGGAAEVDGGGGGL